MKNTALIALIIVLLLLPALAVGAWQAASGALPAGTPLQLANSLSYLPRLAKPLAPTATPTATATLAPPPRPRRLLRAG